MPPLTALPPPSTGRPTVDVDAVPGEPPAGKAASGGPPPGHLPARVRLVPWVDPVVEAAGVDPRSAYVELFWLPVLGPSATWLVRRFADLLDLSPEGDVVDLAELSRSLGVGGLESRHAPLRRAVRRCARFGLLRAEAPDRLAVRRLLGPLPQRHLAQLPDGLQARHRRWEGPHPDGEAVRRRARLLALDALMLGEPPGMAERRLLASGVHPALAHETAKWAHDRTTRPSPAEPSLPDARSSYAAEPGRR